MAIYFNCPGCSRRLRVPDEMAGRKSRCPKCDALGRIPEYSEPPLQPPDEPDDEPEAAPAEGPSAFQVEEPPAPGRGRRAAIREEEDGPPPPARPRRSPPAEEEDDDYRRPSREVYDPKENRPVVASGLNLIRIGAIVQYGSWVFMALMFAVVILLFGTAMLSMLQAAAARTGGPGQPPPSLPPPSDGAVAAAGAAVFFVFVFLAIGGLAAFAAYVLRLIGQIQCLWAPEAEGVRGWAIGMVCTQGAVLLTGFFGALFVRNSAAAMSLSSLLPVANEACLLVFLYQLSRLRANDELAHEVGVYAVVWVIGGVLAVGTLVGGYLFGIAAAVGVGATTKSAGGGVAVFLGSALVIALLVFAITGYVLMRYIGLLTVAKEVASRGRARRADG